MYSPTQRNRVVAAIGAMTTAIKAQRVLAAEGITAEVVALSPKETRHGCAYGLEFAKDDERTVRAALQAARISPSQFLSRP